MSFIIAELAEFERAQLQLATGLLDMAELCDGQDWPCYKDD